MSTPIYLLGMMGSGKSSVGRRLAERLGVAFHDLDAEIERRTQATVAQLFARGEGVFRDAERRVLASLDGELRGRGEAAVVALGGGAYLDAENRARVDRGRAVYLEVAAAELLARLDAEARRERPFFGDERTAFAAQTEARFLALLEARAPIYRLAAHRVDADAELDEVVRRVHAAVGELAA